MDRFFFGTIVAAMLLGMGYCFADTGYEGAARQESGQFLNSTMYMLAGGTSQQVVTASNKQACLIFHNAGNGFRVLIASYSTVAWPASTTSAVGFSGFILETNANAASTIQLGSFRGPAWAVSEGAAVNIDTLTVASCGTTQ